MAQRFALLLKASNRASGSVTPRHGSLFAAAVAKFYRLADDLLPHIEPGSDIVVINARHRNLRAIG